MYSLGVVIVDLVLGTSETTLTLVDVLRVSRSNGWSVSTFNRLLIIAVNVYVPTVFTDGIETRCLPAEIHDVKVPGSDNSPPVTPHAQLKLSRVTHVGFE